MQYPPSFTNGKLNPVALFMKSLMDNYVGVLTYGREVVIKMLLMTNMHKGKEIYREKR